MSKRSFDLIKAPPLKKSGSDFIPPPDPPVGKPGWLNFLYGGLIALALVAVITTVGLMLRDRANAHAKAVITRDWHGTTLEDPYAHFEDLADPVTESWIAAQRQRVTDDLQWHDHYDKWEAWFYKQLELRPHQVMSLSTVESRSWWLTSSGEGIREVRTAETYTAPTEGTLLFQQTGGGEEPQPESLFPSPDGQHVLVLSVPLDRTAPGELMLLSTSSTPGARSELTVPCAPGGRAVWLPDSSGFWYSVLDDEAGQFVTSLQLLKGTSQNVPSLVNTAKQLGGVSDDGRWLIISESRGSRTHALFIRPNTPTLDAVLQPLWDRTDEVAWGAIPGGEDPHAYLVIHAAGLDSYRLERVPLDGSPSTTLVDPLIQRPMLVAAGASHLAVLREELGGWVVQRYTLEGEPVQTLALGPEWRVYPGTDHAPGHLVRVGMSGIATTWRMCDFDPDTGQLTELVANASTFLYAQADVREVPVKASDGIDLRVTIVRPMQPAADEPSRRTILYADGARSNQTGLGHGFLAGPWVDAGGVWVATEVRGSGDRDLIWGGGGSRSEKERAVQDLLDVAAWLVAEGITQPDQLVLCGADHGGWLVTQAAMTKPDAIAGVIAISPVTDLTTLPQSGPTSWWQIEYGNTGSLDSERDLHLLSPYHRLANATGFPPMFFAAAEDNTYIDVWQATKMTARLQAHPAAADGQIPVYCFVAPTGGTSLLHGSDSDWEILISALTFASRESGLVPRFRPARPRSRP